MTDHRCANLLVLLLSTTLALLATPAVAGEPPAGSSRQLPDSQWLSVETAGGGLVFRTLVADQGIAVRVTGPGGFVFERASSGADDSVAFEPSRLADGAYKYEVRGLQRVTRTRRPEEVGGGPDGAPARVLAGGFRVQQGAINMPSAVPESPATGPSKRSSAESVVLPPGDLPEVVLTNGDGVIRNSLCVGFDCPDSPAFDDSTILLMENNTRIKFGDTSNSPFPNSDWEIEANSSLSGGASYLGFNDCGSADNDGGCASDLVFAVEAGARSSALYVESDGDVGLGTSNPVLDLHIVTGNTPSIRLDQDGSSGFTPQVWDVGSNEANFFVRDVTSGSRLPFRIRPGAPTSSIEIATNGDVGVGTAAPKAPVDIVRNGATNAAFRLENTGGAVPSTWFFSAQSANGGFVLSPTGFSAPFKIFTGAPQNSIVIGQQGGTDPAVGIHKVAGLTHPLQVGTNSTNGNGAHVTAAGVWTNGSSRRNKTDIRPLGDEEALAALAGLTPVLYRGAASPDGEQYVGFIAEDVPDLVAQIDRESLSPMDIVAVLTRVLQLERARNEELAARIEHLEARLGEAPGR